MLPTVTVRSHRARAISLVVTFLAMNANERPACAAPLVELLRAARTSPPSLVGSHIDREERDARDVVRFLHVIATLRQNTARA